MRELKFSIRHRGCWSSEAGEKFPSVKGALLANLFERKGDSVFWSFLWKFEAKDESEIKKFLTFFQNHKTIKDSEIIFQKGNSAIVHEKSVPESAEITDTIYKNKCFVLWDMSVSNGFEHWRVLAEKPQYIKNLIKNLNKLGDLIIEKIGQYEITKLEFDLTEKQLKALKLAISSGYYSWPRKITLEELAAISGVSRRTFQDHLRKAEGKVLSGLFS